MRLWLPTNFSLFPFSLDSDSFRGQSTTLCFLWFLGRLTRLTWSVLPQFLPSVPRASPGLYSSPLFPIHLSARSSNRLFLNLCEVAFTNKITNFAVKLLATLYTEGRRLTEEVAVVKEEGKLQDLKQVRKNICKSNHKSAASRAACPSVNLLYSLRPLQTLGGTSALDLCAPV